jgi:glycosyltransferase involved in cell wall biosynthesis
VSARRRVLHVITDLGQGGAEAVLYRLIGATSDEFEHAVVSLHQDGVYGQPLRARGVSVTALGMPRGRATIAGLRRLRRITAEYRPHVVQTRLDHANLVGALAARFAGAPPVVWAVHSTDLGPLRFSWKTRIVRRACAQLSRVLPRFIVSDAHSSAALHRRIGFSASKLMVVPNGVDPSMFRPDAVARERMRRMWGVAPETALLGCVARWDPLKDHENLLRALKLTRDRAGNFRCVLVGRGMSAENADLQAAIDRCGVADVVILAGSSSDVPGIMNAIDVHVLASRSESLPVAVIEAMACGTPCVVTDVGDARQIVGDTGWVVSPRDSVALAAALEAALAALRSGALKDIAEQCRARVVREYSLARMGAEYAALWSSVADLPGEPAMGVSEALPGRVDSR